ncbi:nitrate- and nitrite sensing domain-containing protein [Streptomyces sp. ST2-7A]|uniref:sensor histidine kinase n=1 Tax=Streptomyces sp. ST2-7A TaxID=2907214 RepID=UPI001F1F496B|nr:nitrate- and nitrite sensing domain-containing protein [Streptomyces sp. ST2-7A]MCE7079904.1 nitrate- and nitrite sensing domain-containing protein [Streptomyces sp. ST2-7A]
MRDEGGGRFSPRNWRVATRLNAILLIPVLVALLFAGLRVNTHYTTWQDAQHAESVAELTRAATGYAHALLVERDSTARPLLEGNTDDPIIGEVRRATDDARAEFDRRVAEMPDDESLRRRLERIREVEPKLTALRQNAYGEAMEGVQTEEGYVEIQNPLMSFTNELGLGTDNLATYGRAAYAVSLGKSANSLQRAIGTHLLISPAEDTENLTRQRVALTSYAYLEGIARSEHEQASTDEEVQRLQALLTESTAELGAGPNREQMTSYIASGQFGPQELAGYGVTPDTWYEAATATFEAYHTLETELVDNAVEEARSIASEARTNMITNSALVIIALLGAFVVAGLMARSMSRNMRTLRGAALGVAEERLPALVRQLSQTNPGQVDTRVDPIPITSRDEIGEVSRAFDRVHGEAVRLAAEQALLRGNVNAIFTNLSTRNQGLIERQLALITDLENNEADPDQLENLFRLDHLATRMRRNGENLLVLAGEDPGRNWNEPIPLVDVLRAASSEVENYERIELSGVPDSEIHGAVVNDLVHLLAELLENATSFSSPQTRVRVTATRLPDGRIMVEIHDKGIGLTAEDFAEINHRLAEPPAVDAEISRRMGLFVVGRLAQRHDIRVQLRPSGEQSGTTSLVMLPEEITHGGGGTERAGDEEFTVSRIVPDGPFTREEQGTVASAAELGFDDSRYDNRRQTGAPLAPLDPVGRSLRRGELRTRAGERPGGEEAGPTEWSGNDAPTDGTAAPAGTDAGYGHTPDGTGEGTAEGTWTGNGYPAGTPAYGVNGYGDGAYGDTGPTAESYGANGYGDNGYGSTEQVGTPGYAGEPDRTAAWNAGAGQAAPTFDGFARESESGGAPPPGPAGNAQSVGFSPETGSDAGGPAAVTGAGLPRRTPRRTPGQPGSEVPWREEREESVTPSSAPSAPPAGGSAWSGGPRREAAEPAGTTSSGLPRRVPRANLTEHTLPESSKKGGPQVSRAPEDVRGRLTNLHRGVRQGRGAGAARARNDQQGYGPGNTYDQER